MRNPYYDTTHPVYQDVDNEGNYLPRLVNFPIVTDCTASFVYSTAETGKPVPSKIRSALSNGSFGPMAECSGFALPDAVIYYGMHLEVSLRLPRTATWIRSTPAFTGYTGEAWRPSILEWNFISNDLAMYQGCTTLSALLSRMAYGITSGQLPYLGDIVNARVPCGVKSPFWPEDHMGMYQFVWPATSEELAFDPYPSSAPANLIDYQRSAVEYIPGWVPGFTLKDCAITFDPASMQFDVSYKIGIATYNLYRMTSHPVTIISKDAWGNIQ